MFPSFVMHPTKRDDVACPAPVSIWSAAIYRRFGLFRVAHPARRSFSRVGPQGTERGRGRNEMQSKAAILAALQIVPAAQGLAPPGKRRPNEPGEDARPAALMRVVMRVAVMVVMSLAVLADAADV